MYLKNDSCELIWMQQQLLKGTKNNYLLQMQKNLMKSIFVALGNIQATEQNGTQYKEI